MKVIPLPDPLHDGTAEQFSYLLLQPAPPAPGASGCPPPPPSRAARLVPAGAAAAARFAALADRVSFWVHAPPAGGCAGGGALAGYGFGGAAASAPGAEGGAYEAELIWSLALPGKLLAVAARDPAEPMHSAVKVRRCEWVEGPVGASCLGPALATGGAGLHQRAALLCRAASFVRRACARATETALD
jgi:hypothetical protein